MNGCGCRYTGNAIYKDLNLCLRNEDRKKIKKYFMYLRMLLEACAVLPQEEVKRCWLIAGLTGWLVLDLLID